LRKLSIKYEDKDMLKFLWWDDIRMDNPQITQYRLCHLVFRLTPSPAILNGVLQHHLASQQKVSPSIAKFLAQSLYVDDFLGGAQNIEEGLSVYQGGNQLMKAGGFTLRKWSTNSKNLDQRISSEVAIVPRVVW